MLKKATIPWTTKTLYNQMVKENVFFDCAVQRGFVWDLDKQSMLINSMIEGYPIPPFYFEKRDDGKYDALDGKQRSITTQRFLSDSFKLTENTPDVTDEEGYTHSIKGCTFSELPEFAQDAIKDYTLTIYYFEGITEEEIKELFFRINNGKALSSTELTRVKAKSINKFQQIAKHNMIDRTVTEKGKAKYNDENIAMQLWDIITQDTPDFATKSFRTVIEKAEVTEEEIETINSALDYVYNFFQTLGDNNKEDIRIAKRIKAKSHLVSSVYFANLCIENGISQEEFNDKIYKFYDCSKTSIDDSYNSSVGAGSAKAESIEKRKNALRKLL